MNKLLVVEDEPTTSEMLRRYFEIVGYEVISALTGHEAIKIVSKEQPKLIILDIKLPDIDGYEVCKQLRSNTETSNIPIIFLTAKDDRRDRLNGLELGADDYITKPFDVEELRLRVHNIIGRMGGAPLVDARTSLPNSALIKERLPKLLGDPETIFFDIQLANLAPFGQRYGPVAANQAIRSTAKVIGDLLNEIDPSRSFIGHPEDDRFLIGLPKQSTEQVEKELPERFQKLIDKLYDTTDKERGKVELKGELFDLMALKLNQVDAQSIQKQFGDKASQEQAEKTKPSDHQEAAKTSSDVKSEKDSQGKEKEQPSDKKGPTA